MFGERRASGARLFELRGPLLAAALLAAAPVQAADRVTIGLSGLWASSRIELQQSRSFTEYAEPARVDWSAEQQAGWGAEGSIEAHIGRRLGVELAVASVRRDGTARISLSSPHPLYLDRPRVASAEAVLRSEERAVHLDLVYRAARGRLRARLSAGGSVFLVSQDLVGDVTYDQAYPYDEITVREVALSRISDRAFGFNVGGELGLRLAGPMALGVGLRYSHARASLDPPKGEAIPIDAGGVQLRLGLRFTL